MAKESLREVDANVPLSNTHTDKVKNRSYVAAQKVTCRIYPYLVKCVPKACKHSET